jgi:hypothetical protein
VESFLLRSAIWSEASDCADFSSSRNPAIGATRCQPLNLTGFTNFREIMKCLKCLRVFEQFILEFCSRMVRFSREGLNYRSPWNASIWVQ